MEVRFMIAGDDRQSAAARQGARYLLQELLLSAPSQLSCRADILLEQMRRTEPRPQRLLCSMQDGACRRRCLLATTSARKGISSAGQADCISLWTDKPIRPPAVHQQPDAASFIGKPRLEIKKGRLFRNDDEHIVTPHLFSDP
jgi:hypothetical protein